MILASDILITKTKTIMIFNTKISLVLATHFTLGQKVKSLDHRVTKCKNILKVIEWSA